LPDKEIQGYLQRLLGYCLTADVQQQVVVFFLGMPASGKSTILRIFKEIAGSYATRLPSDTFVKNREAARIITYLIDKRVGILDEVIREIEVENLKLISGGNKEISVRFLFEEAQEVDLFSKIVIAANSLPRWADPSNAIFRRLKIVHFNKSFVGKENFTLTEELLKEKDAIGQWMLGGYIKFLTAGLHAPNHVKEMDRELMCESDDILSFITERCECGDGLTVSASTLYNAYTAWKGIEKPVTQTSFGRSLKAKGFDVIRVSGGYKFRTGLTLKEV